MTETRTDTHYTVHCAQPGERNGVVYAHEFCFGYVAPLVYSASRLCECPCHAPPDPNPRDWLAALARAEASYCDHVGTERVERTAHGYLGDAPRGTRQTICVDCGTILDAIAPARPDERAYHEAIGWLVGAIEDKHPGFVQNQADRARGHNDPVAAVLDDWAGRLAPEVAS